MKTNTHYDIAKQCSLGETPSHYAQCTGYPIMIDAMSYKGQKHYTSCKVQSHTITPLLIYYKHDIIFQIHNRNNNKRLISYMYQNENSLFLSINK